MVNAMLEDCDTLAGTLLKHSYTMNRLSRAERAQIIRTLVEGNSVRSTSRLTGFARNTITTLLVDLARACSAYMDERFRDLTSSRIECDEICAFCYAKARNVPEQYRNEPGYGDVWTWVAIDPDTKLVPTWLVGERDAIDATAFLMDLAGRLRYRVQLTTDGYQPRGCALDTRLSLI